MVQHRITQRAVGAALAWGLVLIPGEATAGQQPSPPASHGQMTPDPVQHEHPAPAVPDDVSHEHQASAEAGLLFPARGASGTAWLPDETPMYGYHREWRRWGVILHGNAFVQFLHEAAPEHRGDSQAGSINWAMAMARRPVGSGWFGVRTMMSLEPLTITGCGYPNLLATGEYGGVGIGAGVFLTIRAAAHPLLAR